jgi:predicted amidophosphoribosyltransferase
VTASELENRGSINVVSRRHVIVCVACSAEMRKSSGRCANCGRPLDEGMFFIAERTGAEKRRSRQLLPKLPSLPKLALSRALRQLPLSR